jgi:hypothetical protein
MSNKFFDITVAKEYSVKNNGKVEIRTAWNKVGRAWLSQSGENLTFEMYHLPNQKYVVQLGIKSTNESKAELSPQSPT